MTGFYVQVSFPGDVYTLKNRFCRDENRKIELG